jgi:hypothetical protein
MGMGNEMGRAVTHPVVNDEAIIAARERAMKGLILRGKRSIIINMDRSPQRKQGFFQQLG